MLHTRLTLFLVSGFALLTAYATAHAGAFESYQVRTALEFSLPGSMNGGLSVMEALPDGRLVVVTTRASGFNPGPAELYLENGVGTRDFRYLGDLPLSGADPVWYNPGAFISTSRNTSGVVSVAVGNSSFSVGVFDASQLIVPGSAPSIGTAAPVAVDWYLPDDTLFVSGGTWYDNRYLMLASGSFGSPSALTQLDTNSSPASPVNPTVVSGPTNGASSGIGFDAAGNLYYGNGYDYGTFGAGDTGQINRYDLATWQAALVGVPLSFGAGSDITQLLSANWLSFDAEGNLIVGGGNSFGSDPNSKNFLALVKLMPDGTVDSIRTFDPDTGNSSNSYSIVLNRATGEILAFDPFGSDPRQVFVISVPEPASVSLAGIALALLLWRKRRR